MRMIGTAIDFKFSEHLTAELVFRQHPLDGFPDQFFRGLFKQLVRSNCRQAAGIAAVTIILFLSQLVSGQADFLGVQDDNKITCVNARGVNGLVLAAQDTGNLGSRPAKDLILQVDNIPVFLEFIFFRN